ncbi:MAG: Smr/MutS family protein [Pseudomonadota bacterium]
MKRRRSRPLNAEEHALWQHVVRSVKPLRAAPVMPEPPPEPATLDVEASVPPRPTLGPAPTPPKDRTKSPPPLAALEPRMRRRLGRGGEVDARIDLHGLTQAAAHRRLHGFILDAQRLGHGVVLVITGKGDGAPAAPGQTERGVLRRAVPLWLADPVLRACVVGFEPASRRHGGEGALYVRIRRRRMDGEP